MDGIVSTESVALHEQIRTEEEVERREQERVEQHARYSIEHANKAGVAHPHVVVPSAAGRGHFFRISLKFIIFPFLFQFVCMFIDRISEICLVQSFCNIKMRLPFLAPNLTKSSRSSWNWRHEDSPQTL